MSRVLTRSLRFVYRHGAITRSVKPQIRTWDFVLTRNIIHSSKRKQGSRRGGILSDPENTGEGQSGVNFDTLGSWNNRLNLNVNVDHSIQTGHLVPEISDGDIGACSLQGRRDVNEDRYLIKHMSPEVVMFAIFDGHGGALAVDYMIQHLPEHITEQINKNPKDLSVVLQNAFLNAQSTFARYLYRNYTGDDAAMNSGTTATVCLLRNGRQLVVATVGDSRGIVCRDGKAVVLTDEHRPMDPGEKERILKAGGRVTQSSFGQGRVNGRLEMSRSLGDVELKAFGVIADPSIRTHMVRHGTDAFLLLTTDGVHYVLGDQELVDVVCTCQDAHEAARLLTDQALQFGSEDNVTAVVVPFGAWGKYAQTKTLQFSFSRHLVSSRD